MSAFLCQAAYTREVNEHIRMSFGVFMDLIGLTDGERGDVWRVCYGLCLSCLQTEKDTRMWMDQMHWYCYYRSASLVWNGQVFRMEKIERSVKHGALTLWNLSPVSFHVSQTIGISNILSIIIIYPAESSGKRCVAGNLSVQQTPRA